MSKIPLIHCSNHDHNSSSVAWKTLSWSEDDTPEQLLCEEDKLPDIDQLISPNRRKYQIRDILIDHFADYCRLHKVSDEKRKVIHSLIACKTGELGYTMIRCPDCGFKQFNPCACGNRNCPSCGVLLEKKWVEERQAEVIPGIPYFHLVFTLPHQLTPVMYLNQKETLDLLFHSVKDTILELSRDNLKMIPGVLMVLHTFGSNLSLHYHLHVLVSGGGLTLDKKSFKRCMANRFFLPVRKVASLYRGKFLDGLKQLLSSGKLQYEGDILKYRNSYEWKKELLDPCYKAEWNVEIKYLSPVSTAGHHSPDETTSNAIQYFARYTNRTAISDSRILDHKDGHVRFRYKKYDGSAYEWKEMDLTADEFIRRFLTHILPPGFAKVRSCGFLAGCVRAKNLALIYFPLNEEFHPSPVKNMSSTELIEYFYDEPVGHCPECSHELEVISRISREEAWKYIRAA